LSKAISDMEQLLPSKGKGNGGYSVNICSLVIGGVIYTLW